MTNNDRPITTYSMHSNNVRNEEKASLNKKVCSNAFKSVKVTSYKTPRMS